MLWRPAPPCRSLVEKLRGAVLRGKGDDPFWAIGEFSADVRYPDDGRARDRQKDQTGGAGSGAGGARTRATPNPAPRTNADGPGAPSAAESVRRRHALPCGRTRKS